MSDELAIRTRGLQIRSVNDLARISNIMADSGYFRDAKDAAQCAVKIMAGQGWGIAPFDAMSGIHIIEGKPSVGAGLMASQVRASGRYDYRVRNMSATECSIEFFQGSESLGVSTFTLEEAKAAGVRFKTSKGEPTPWAKFPRNMLFARAMSNGVKWYCPDIFSAPVYTPEELGAHVNEDGDVIDVRSSVAPERRDEPAAQAVASEPTPEPEPVPSTAKQRQAMGIAMRQLRFPDDDAGKQQARDFFSWLAGRAEPVTSATEFTLSEATVILDRIGSGENGSYKTDDKKLDAAKSEWQEQLDYERSVAEHGEPEPIKEFEPNKRRTKVKGMAPIEDDEPAPDLREAVPVEEQQEAIL